MTGMGQFHKSSSLDVSPLDVSPLDVSPFSLEVVRKRIKHIYFRVYPHQKKILVSVPIRLSHEELEKAVLSKKEWLLRQIKRAESHQPQKLLKFLTENAVWFRGRQYPVKICPAAGSGRRTVLENGRIKIDIKRGASPEQAEKRLENWLRKQLTREIGILVEKWVPAIGVKVAEYRVRKMKTRWGSCNIRVRRIWLNLALVHLPVEFLEYVVVHEMVHLLERKHNQRFKSYMDIFIPDWRQMKAQMDQFVL